MNQYIDTFFTPYIFVFGVLLILSIPSAALSGFTGCTRYKASEGKRRFFLCGQVVLFIYQAGTLFMIYGLPGSGTAFFTSWGNFIINLFIFVIQLLFFIKYSPIFDKKLRLLSTVDIIEGTDEIVVFIDERNVICFFHNGTGIEGFNAQADRIINVILQKHKLDREVKNPAAADYCEDDLTYCLDGERVLHYKLTRLFNSGGLFERMIVIIRDITRLKELYNTLDEKNRLLREALERHKRHVFVARRLITENERARILEVLNETAGKYLKDIKGIISGINAAAPSGPEELRIFLNGWNEKMLKLTRDTINHVRHTVYELKTDYGAMGGSEDR